MVDSETDFILGMLINQIWHTFFYSIIQHNLEITIKDKGV